MWMVYNMCIHADINECTSCPLNNCTEEKNQECHNTLGSYRCECLSGFTLDPTKADNSCIGNLNKFNYCVYTEGNATLILNFERC